MKTIEEIRTDILGSLGQTNHPVGILLDSYLQKVITDIVRAKLIDFQLELSNKELITDYDWGFEGEANDFLSYNPIR
jgi:hypothetical protein